jgi:hypothetical protein
MKIEDDETYSLQISAKGPCTVTAGDIICPAQVEILNKDLEIAHLESGVSLEMELKAKNGRGYVSSDINKQRNQGSSQGIGTVFTDSIYTPIEKVAYNVEPTRVGEDVKYDSLTMEIWTDGSITPQKALSMGAKILIDHLDIIAGINDDTYSEIVIFDLYTLENGQPVQLACTRARSRYFLRSDGSVLNEGSNGAGNSIFIVNRLYGSQLVPVESAFTWFTGEPTDGYYHQTDGYFYEPRSYDDYLDEQQFTQLITGWESSVTVPSLTQIA